MKIFFSVGEPSGDLHASRLMTALRRERPTIEVYGLGGPLMEAAGLRSVYRLTDLAVMGFLQVLPLLWKFWSVYRIACAELRRNRPDLVVLVDFPGFNWWIAAAAKRLGIRVVYYMPPQLWAWAPWRIRKVRKYVDLVLCSLPFEYEWYRQRGVAAQLVGHPFFDEVAEHPLDSGFLQQIEQAQSLGHPVVAILPGSRRNEVRDNFPIQMQVMRELVARVPQVQFLVANYKAQQREMCQAMLAEQPPLPVSLHVGKVSEILERADACVQVSGSVSLEILARAIPTVVIYKANRWLAQLAQRVFMTCRYISLPNLIENRVLQPEFWPMNDEAEAVVQICDQIQPWLIDASARGEKIRELQSLRSRIMEPGATQRAADRIIAFSDRVPLDLSDVVLPSRPTDLDPESLAPAA